MSDNNLNYQDEQFWQDPSARALEVLQILDKEKVKGLRIAAPSQVDITQNETLPIVVCQVESFADQPVRPYDNVLITAVAPDTGNLLVNFANFTDGAVPLAPIPPEFAAAGPTPEGQASSVNTSELRAILGIPWKDSKLILTAIGLDRVSNRREVTLTSGSYVDPEVQKFIEEERNRRGPPPIYPVPHPHLARYDRLSQSPEIPTDPGLILKVERVIALRGDPMCVLYGAYRIPLKKHWIVPESRVAAFGFTPGDDTPYRVVVPIALMSTGSKRAAATGAMLQIPCYERIDPANPPATITGYFAIDLLGNHVLEPLAQTNFIYAFCGEMLVGPTVTAFVHTDSLGR